MIPVGYMGKRVARRPGWLAAAGVEDIYSVSGCVSPHFADYVPYWKHNGYWFFDTVEAIQSLARAQSIDLAGCQIFYYEVFEQEFDDRTRHWQAFVPEEAFRTAVRAPAAKRLEGYDVVTFSAHTGPECSPLSCNGLAASIRTNRHCLLISLKEATECIESGALGDSEPGPLRVFAVYSGAEP
jgi:hypothetical protein